MSKVEVMNFGGRWKTGISRFVVQACGCGKLGELSFKSSEGLSNFSDGLSEFLANLCGGGRKGNGKTRKFSATSFTSFKASMCFERVDPSSICLNESKCKRKGRSSAKKEEV
ncbi:hypothetical protein Nepgr_022550 [Nepenthes gracilis]|uniref:Uncharacterized protein n=1 Tax=Nepenthes gracilis TaxID=150966 RepID=A0AAD3T0Z0_NEPGR|nr:hypothetical protein Nepgr_022550 [Nepenthes gracilis]